MIWLCLVVPVITCIILYVFFKREVTSLEFVGLIGTSVIFILICKLIIGQMQVTDTEFWNGWVTESQYHESWTEIIVETVIDSDGKSHLQTRTVHHPPEYYAFTSNDEKIIINKKTWNHLLNKWGGEINRRWSSDPVKNSVKPSLDIHYTPIVTQHFYKNKTQASNSVYKFEKIEDPEKAGVYEYPVLQSYGMIYDPIIGLSTPEAERCLFEWNSQLGRKCQVHMLICIYQDKPIQTFYDQKNYWQGGNKNEFIVCIGMNEKTIDWCEIMSWSDVEDLKTDVSFYVRNMKHLDLIKFINEYLGPQVQERFVRKKFEDFDFIIVEPPLWAVIITFILTIMFCCGISCWLVTNEYDDDCTNHRRLYNSWRR